MNGPPVVARMAGRPKVPDHEKEPLPVVRLISSLHRRCWSASATSAAVPACRAETPSHRTDTGASGWRRRHFGRILERSENLGIGHGGPKTLTTNATDATTGRELTGACRNLRRFTGNAGVGAVLAGGVEEDSHLPRSVWPSAGGADGRETSGGAARNEGGGCGRTGRNDSYLTAIEAPVGAHTGWPSTVAAYTTVGVI